LKCPSHNPCHSSRGSRVRTSSRPPT